MTVRESIKAAFANVPYPGDDRIADHQNCLECDDVRAHFRGATWFGHSVEELQQYRSALPLFTPEAFQYFLPAFMLVSLEAWHEADDIPFSVMCMCLPPDPNEDEDMQEYGKKRIEILTHQQREAIAAYLKEWANSDAPLTEAYAEDIPRAIELLLGHEPAT